MPLAYQDARGRFTGKPHGPRIKPGETRMCSKCHDEMATSLFSSDPKNRDGLSSWCKPCRAEDAREKRRIARSELTPEEIALRKTRLSMPQMILRVATLLRAARAARTAGCWRGRAGVRAYRDLGIAIEAFHVEDPENPESMERDAPPCTCNLPELGCALHSDAVAAFYSVYPGRAA